MTKYRTLAPGDGITGPTGLEYRSLTNDMIPADAYFVPADFVWTGDLSSVADRTLVISYDHDVSGNITLPAGCILLFDGGKLSSVGTITGNNSRIINPRSLPCFDATIVFAGTWSETECNYQWFGAKSNPTFETYSNECSAAINVAHNSPFKVKPLPGFYYITNTLVISSPKYLDLGISAIHHQDDPNTMPLVKLVPDHVMFYTNQDIDVMDIQTSSVNINGGTIKINVPYTKDAVSINAQTANSIRGSLKMAIIGDFSSCQTEGVRGKAFHWDTASTKYGAMANWDIDLNILFMPIGVHIEGRKDDTFSTTWMGVSDFKLNLDGCKQGLIVEGGFQCRYKGYTQTRNVLALSEVDLYQVEINDGTYDFFNWDLAYMREEPEGSGHYYPGRGTLITGNGVTLVGHSLFSSSIHYKEEWMRPKAIKNITHESDILILKEKANAGTFISEFHNGLIGFTKSADITLSVKAFEGGAIDFDTETRDGATIGLTESAEYTITNFEYLFEQRGGTPTITVTPNSNRDTDFVELFLQWTGDVRFYMLYMLLTQSQRGFKRVQILTKNLSNVWEITHDATEGLITRNPYYKFNINGLKRGMIIRLIGITDVVASDIANDGTRIGTITIQDLAASMADYRPNFVPKLEAPLATMHVVLNQSGTTDGTVETYLDTFYASDNAKRPITLERQSTGYYLLKHYYFFIDGKCLPKSVRIYTELGSILIEYHNSQYYKIHTYNTSGDLSDGILVDQAVIINRYW